MPESRVRSSKMLKLLPLLIAIVGCLWVLTSFIELKHSGQRLIALHTEQLARSMGDIAALNAGEQVNQQQLNQLQSLVARLAEQPFVAQVEVYDHRGQRLASTQPQDEAQAQQLWLSELKRPYITELSNSEGKTLGYLRINLHYQNLLEQSSRQLEEGQRRLMLIVLASIAVGILLTSVLQHKRRRQRERAVSLKQQERQRRAKQAHALLADIAARGEQDTLDEAER